MRFFKPFHFLNLQVLTMSLQLVKFQRLVNLSELVKCFLNKPKVAGWVVTAMSGPNVIKLFSAVFYEFLYELQCLALASLSILV
jgi:hypothetical protein